MKNSKLQSLIIATLCELDLKGMDPQITAAITIVKEAFNLKDDQTLITPAQLLKQCLEIQDQNSVCI
jgi:hypothetical protein